ncbi:Xaa-Pro aminopeptidase [Balneicella halophila]|uniref:Xaa-Pro aminopeptidase n=1 Tax=Balneicella halophila TaxID=1537566 RepID=A0A7L4UNW1_BALHA|nr:aminopeptidase P family protein [Balneicella halophila]PVX50788.1 Xaa-Pro aminopeptidase [Balneicella halophila]
MFDTKVYKNRRQKLATAVKKGLMLFLGNDESPMNATANTYRYRQDSTFRYLFGINSPGFAAVIDIDNGKEYIFANDFEIDDIIWMGTQPKVKDIAAQVGVNETMPLKKLDSFLSQNIDREIHYLPPYRANNILRISNLLGIKYTYVQSKASEKLIKALVDMRSKKEAIEIEEIRKACNIAYDMHTTAMRMCHPGVSEREIAGAIEGVALSQGAGISFPIILSQNGQTLHNHSHDGILTKGRLMLTDCGAEGLTGYASDCTRTSPVGGEFTTKQKEIYSIVLKVNNTIKDLARPGETYKKLHLIACKIMAEGLKDLGIMKGDVENAVKVGAHALFMPHGLGHMMGMDVHDMEDYGEDYVGYNDKVKRSEQFGLAYLRLGRKLEEDFVITNEPGIYFIPDLINLWKSENKFTDFINYDKLNDYLDFGGVRLEDDLLITKKGCEILGDKRIPITIDEVQDCIKSGR